MLTALLAGCAGGIGGGKNKFEPDDVDSSTTHTRHYEATQAQTCEAARRALLSQGYMISTATNDQATGRKSFQPGAETHVEVEIRVVCAHEGVTDDKSAVAFVSALQDRYGIKKVNNSASLGVGGLGSLSLPFSASDDAMVKVASETITDARFYERFFTLIGTYLLRDGVLTGNASGPSTGSSNTKVTGSN
ncbi:MAG TPA: DUF2242 domain-containing protein [Burkholderiaceae bacterium]